MTEGIARLRPVTSRIMLKVRPRSLSEVAKHSVELGAGRFWSARPLLYPPGEMDRIIGHHRDSDPIHNMALIECDNVWQGPIRAYQLEDVIIADGTLLARDWVGHIRKQARRALLPPIEVHLKEAAMASTAPSERYFGHWLRDQLTTEILIGDMNLRSLAMPGTTRSSEPGYRAATGLAAEKLPLARVSTLWVFDDVGITDHRIARIERLRKLVRAHDRKCGPRRLFLSRGKQAVGRILDNETQLAEALATLGFLTVYPETMSVPDLIDAFANADLVVGAEGSAFAHALVCAPREATFLILKSPDHFNLHYRLYCEAMDMQLGVLIGESTGPDSFRVEMPRLQDFIAELPSYTHGRGAA